MATKVEYKGYTLEFPDNATDDDIYKYIQENESQFDSIAPAKQEEQAPQQEDSILGPTTRMLANAGANIANIPASVADSVASAASWAGGKLGIGDGTYIPAPRIEVSDEYKPRGAIEEIASEALPFLITGGASAAPKAATKLGRLEQALTRNASQSVVGSAANNSDGELGADFAADVALNAGAGAGAEKVIGGIANTIRAGSEVRREAIRRSVSNENEIIDDIKRGARELHAFNRSNKLFEQGIPAGKLPDEAGNLVEVTKRVDLGGVQDYVNSLPKGDAAQYAFDNYIKRITGGNFSTGDTPLPADIRNIYANKDITKAAEDKILEEVRANFNRLGDYNVKGLMEANNAIMNSRNGLGKLNPSVSVGALPKETRRALGLKGLQDAIASISSKSEEFLPGDAGTWLRTGSKNAIDRSQQALKNTANSEADSIRSSLDESILNAARSGEELSSGKRRAMEGQIDAYRTLGSKSFDRVRVDDISRDKLVNLLTSSSQAANKAGDVTIDTLRPFLDDSEVAAFREAARRAGELTNDNPINLATRIGGANAIKEAKAAGNPSVVSSLLGVATGGTSTGVNVLGAIPNLAMSRAISRDLARVRGEMYSTSARGTPLAELANREKGVGHFELDNARNAIGDAVDNVGTNVNVAGVLGGDMDDENEKRIEQLDDWATKNGIPSEILSQAVAIKGSDLGSLKGINAIKGLALDLHTESRANDSTVSLSESFNPDHTLATRQISQAMREAMNGLSDDEQEEIIDDYLDSVHLEEDEKLVGLKLQRAIQKAVQHALDKSS